MPIDERTILMIKKALITLLLLLVSFPMPILAAQKLDLPARAGMAVDLGTGKILYEKDADDKLPIANLSRLITVYLTYQAVEEGKIGWDDPVTISKKARDLIDAEQVVNIPMPNERYTVRDLTKAVIISASASASIALAETIAGSEDQFVDQMRQLLDQWGITNHLIVNASGTNNYYVGFNIYPGSGREEENSLSARDLTIISHKLLTDYPDVLDISQASKGDFAGQPLFTYNYLLENMPYARPGATGLITGSSEYSGSSLISVSTENHMQVLTVIIGAEGGEEDPEKRFAIANSFLDELATEFHLQKVLTAYTPFQDSQAPVLDGKKATVDTLVQDDFYVVTTPATKDKVELVADFSQHPNYAPIADEQVVGRVVYKDQTLVGQGYLGDPPHMNLIANDTVKRSNPFKVIWNHFVRYVLAYL